MIPLTYEENNSYENQKACHICKKEMKMCIPNIVKYKIIVIILKNM